MENEKPYLKSKREAARYLNIAIPTLERLIKQGRGPVYVRVGSQMRFTPESLVEFIRANSRRDQSSAPTAELVGVSALTGSAGVPAVRQDRAARSLPAGRPRGGQTLCR